MDLKRIVYVDDEEDILQVATLCLETVGGFEVMSCENGFIGYDKVLQEKPDLILLDVMMPGMDGPETLMKIKSNQDVAAIPVIFMTARVQPEDIKKYMDLGAVGVIEKPFDPMKLAERVSEIWGEFHAK